MSAEEAEPVVLVWGESDFLVREAARALLGDARPTEVDAREWVPGATADLATPSLFGERRVLLVTGAQHLSDQALEEVARYTEHPSAGSTLVLTALVGPRARGAPRALLKAFGDRVKVRRAAVDRKDLPAWVRDRARARGLRVTSPGASALVQTLGQDPAVLDQAIAQLADSHPAEGLTPEAVSAQFRGFGDRYMWELCDAAFTGNLPNAMRVLAGLMDAGEEPLAVLGTIAARVRDLIRVRALSPRTPPAEVARVAGLRFDWQARRYRDQARRYTERDLRAVHEHVVEADRAIKQGATGDVVLGMVIARIAGEPSAGVSVRRRRGA